MYPLKTRFLVVDDIAAMRKMIKKVLNEEGYQNVVEAQDGKNAFEKINDSFLKNEPIDFIISDWNMPYILGIDLLKKCKADDRFKNIPFILVTDESDQKNIIEGIQAGVSEFIVKPFNALTVKAKLEKVYQKKSIDSKSA
jgi:two-component system chemotaxis response regulator CheY